MKLYLSSYRVPVADKLFELLPGKSSEIKMAIIPNAKDYYAELARNFKINDYVVYMKELGFNPEIFDLRDYDSENIKEALREFDFIWVAGGNTFNLRHEMRRSGLDKFLKELLEGGMVYGGDSAGALIVGPSIKGVEHADEPAFAESQIFEGLGAISNVVIPHADNSDFGDAIEKLIDEHKSDSGTVVLNDNQAFVINGEKTEVVTATD